MICSWDPSNPLRFASLGDVKVPTRVHSLKTVAFHSYKCVEANEPIVQKTEEKRAALVKPWIGPERIRQFLPHSQRLL